MSTIQPQPQAKCQADEWIEQAYAEDLRLFFHLLSIKLIGATINDIAANNEDRQKFGWRWLLLDDDFYLICALLKMKPYDTMMKMVHRSVILRERRNRIRQ